MEKTVGILGYGEIGQAMAKICEEAGLKVLIRELDYDQIANNQIEYLHVNIPMKNQERFVEVVSKTIRELSPRLTIINTSTIPGTTKVIYKLTKFPIVHSPVIGVHPDLYRSIKSQFVKVIGPTSSESLELAKAHFRQLGIKTESYDSSDNSEAAKLLDLVYYAWNIVFCKWLYKTCKKLKLNFNQVYTRQNQIYNQGYSKIIPNVVRPILIPYPGPITGHCTIPDTQLFHNLYPSALTQFILDQNLTYFREVTDLVKQRQGFLRKTRRLKV